VGADRGDVLAALRAEDVANHLGIKGPWRGRWMRSRRCGRTDHGTDAFGLARDGMWHCHACDEGGDLLKLVAVGEGIDIRADFPKVLELAAQIAGVVDEDDFGGGKVAPKARPAPPPVEPLDTRIALAKRRGLWAWGRLVDRMEIPEGRRSSADLYLGEVRGLPVELVRGREHIKDTPIRCAPSEWSKGGPDLEKLVRMFSVPGLAVPVRSPVDGAIVDIRIRRLEPQGDQPKIIGMLGGVTSAPACDGKGRELVGCYGFPHELSRDTVIVVEGLVDYLTALALWPDADVVGAVEAGTLSLVAGVAAAALARHGDTGRIVIVEHDDGKTKDGREGAAERAMWSDPNAATKVAVRILGPRRVGWLFCDGTARDGSKIKDLNDLYRDHKPTTSSIRWWADVGDGKAA
jgi:hypothetical protein